MKVAKKSNKVSNPNDTTVLLTDIGAALSATDQEAFEKPAALIVVGGDLNGTIFDLDKETITIGRGTNTDITLEFQGISRHHLTVIQIQDQTYLEDAGSKNGTYLNNKKINSRVILRKGDIIKLGSVALKYLPTKDPERLTYDKLNMDANTDALTKCYNKAYFNNSLETEIKKCKVSGTPLSLVIFDLDHFKKLNDNYGHDAGDFVLKEISDVIRANGVREEDIFARYGGEEFCILLPKTNLKNAFEISERFRKTIEGHQFIYDGKRLPVTTSIGVADYRKGVLSGTDLFRRADEAVYISKNGGRNQVSFYKE